MKLLLDENLSPRLPAAIQDIFPGSKHIEDCGFISSSDGEIWRYAQKNGFAIVSKDSDFSDLSVLFQSPPKVIWLRVGNCGTSRAALLIRSASPQIESFLADKRQHCLVLTLRR